MAGEQVLEELPRYDLSKCIDLLYKVDGYDARQVMIEALTGINNGEINATTFNGKTEDKYLKTIDLRTRCQAMSSRINKDPLPSETSENLIMTKGIRSVIGPIPYLNG